MPRRSPPPVDLDPFAFPTETSGRYRMLITAALVVVWGAAAFVSPEWLVLTRSDLEVDPRFNQWALETIEAGGWRTLSREELEEIRPIVMEGARRSIMVLCKWLGRMTLSTLLVAATLGAGWLLYRWQPRWRSLARRTAPLTPENAPGPVGELRRLITRAGLSPGVRLAHLPGHMDWDGFAFGPSRRETVLLYCPLDVLSGLWEETMRVVAYHEVAHIANGDVRYRELSRALWTVVGALLLVITLAAAGGLVSPHPEAVASTPSTVTFVVGNLLLLGVVGWIGIGLMRVREFYADWRVAAWGRRAALARHLRLPERRGSQWRALAPVKRLIEARPRLARALGAVREHVWRHHPSFRRRREVLEDGRPLFRVSAELALVSGLLLTVVLAHAQLLLADLLLFARSAGSLLALMVGPLGMIALFAVGWLALTLLTYLITGTLGIQVQRQAVADLVTGPRKVWGYLRLVRIAALFAVGLETGLLLTPASFVRAAIPIPYLLGWLGTFTLMTWIWLIHLHGMSRLLFGSWTGDRPPRRRQRLLTWLSAGLLAVLYSPVLAVRVTLHQAADPAAMQSLAQDNANPREIFVFVFVLTSIVLMAVALAGYILVGSASTVAAGALAWRRTTCPTCGDRRPRGLAVGRRCAACGSPLAAWLLHRPEPLPAAGDGP